MAAPTNTYCSYATGNDYKGATFTDGAYTSATKTLVKAGAFAASKVNHWLYLESNDGGSIVAGYYKIATWTDANTVVLATDAGAGVDDDAAKCTQHDGTTSLPWRSVQGALDLITRDATNGDQVNVKAGTAQVLSAALAFTTYGTPAEGTPVIIRGYTTAANDGGIGEINCGAYVLLASSAITDIGMIDLKIYGAPNNLIYTYGARCFMYHCEVYQTGGSGNVNIVSSLQHIVGCKVHDALGAGYALTNVGMVYGCYVYNSAYGINCLRGVNNIVVDATTIGMLMGDTSVVIGNSIYSSSAATGKGISAPSGATNGVILNNIVEGYSGVGGIGISAVADLAVVGYNATFNCTTPTSYVRKWGDLTANDVVCASSPFTNAAAGDFSLNTAVAGAIDGAFPGAWYGPAATVDHADIGAVQNPAGSGGGMLRANKRGNKQ